ncbi:putative bifunctional UDP-N-acetylglucosamine transferase and deubiquitinase ALG13 isoform X2 [Corythoichthys intestinalis]|uniref:putative bifunctional UDP-N-acetylglucosamine transferase and deubiquitinase ALG13 isoform X2 n=1 Tax=Corythoichthys intestinalis TaxID=161448 RepID=UPI0025A5612E|nr:putative bifunctional UDP-N-acetylglucosamine transferase and deubiquitinase ALG13 isoform X2 [Corythoichthys intestinalis]
MQKQGLKKYFVNMDDYLASLGLYRKMVARDASSLFRAVSEQLYYSQNYHRTIRQECADFMRANALVFEPFVEGSFEKYLERLEDPKETVGQVEIKALSELYRRRFVIYRYPGKAATVISESDDFGDEVTLSCSINCHYDIVYPRSYPASAALCQALVYELLYTKVFGFEEAELSQATEAFKAGGRRYRNSLSVCSDADAADDRGHATSCREEAESGEEKPRVSAEDVKPPSEAPPPSRLSLPYKVMKSLDGDVYRNVEFDVWQDTCKEMQKTDYMVFAGRQYFLGDKCQVRLEPKGKYFNAFIQEVGMHSAAVTVFIEELGEKHCVPLTDVKAVNPVPAWNVSAVPRKGDPDGEPRANQRRHRYFRKTRGAAAKGPEPAPPPPYGSPAPSPLPPRFQPAGRPPTTAPYEHYQHNKAARYGATRSSARLVNRHLMGPQLSYYPAGRRYYDYDGLAFRSRRSRRHLAATLTNQCHYFGPDPTGPAEMDAGSMAYYRMGDDDRHMFATLAAPSVPHSPGAPPPNSSYRAQRGPGVPPPTPPAGGALGCSSEEEHEDAVLEHDFREDFYDTQGESRHHAAPRGRILGVSDAGVYSSDASANPAGQDQEEEEEEGGVAESPPRADGIYDYTQQATKPMAVIFSSPASSSASSPSSSSSRAVAAPAAHAPAAAVHAQARTVAAGAAMPAGAPWLVPDLGEGLCSLVAPPPYSYDPNGGDLPRDCRLVQFYFNLGVQWYHQSCWQQQQQQAVAAYPSPYPVDAAFSYQEAPPHVPPSYPEAGRGPPPLFYQEPNRAVDTQADVHGAGPTHSLEGSSLGPPPANLYPEQTAPMLHLPYEAGPPAYAAPPPPLPHHAYHAHCVPAPVHWGGHTSRVYCPASGPPHVVSYITAPPTHFLPPSASA